MNNLKPRLLEIVKMMIPPNAERLPLAVCDVGTDHGYIPIYLVQNGVSFAIASDVSKGSAEKAIQNVRKFGLEDKISVRVGDGLAVLSDYEADTVIIAGMGGILMTEILSKGLPKGVKQLVLQPMRAVYELRKWLSNNGYCISDESLVFEDKKLYHVLLVTQGEEKNTQEFDYFIGARLRQKKHPLFLEHVKKEYSRIQKRLDGLKCAGLDADKELLSFQDQMGAILSEEVFCG